MQKFVTDMVYGIIASKIGKVYDASEKTYGQGYWTIGAVALTENHRQPIPVYEKLYPCKNQGGPRRKDILHGAS